MDCPLIKGIIVGETEVYESHGVLGNRIFEIIHTGMMYRGKKAMLEIFQDITDRKKNEKELIDAKDKAEESDRLKTAFLHNISHEIRTPMNAIVGFSALLGEPALDAETQQSYIETIMQSSNHLLSIITDIIDISNIEANIVKIARTGINVNFTLNSICNQFSIKAGEKKIKLICETGLTDSGALIITDNTKLTQILTNLLSNAIKFTDEGTVKLSCRMVANFLEFSVSDTGIGIPAEYHAKIFDRFYQVQNAVSRLYEGTGLGLAISKAYVDIMGGKIWLSSKPGKGTTFCFTIPYERQTVVPEPVIEKHVNEGFVFAEKKTILVAEDIDSNFKLINYFLSKSNTNILRAFNGKEAVEIALAEKDIDLILMDIKMPEMDGYTAVKLIREANIKTPIIAQTAYADDKEKVIECGCNGHISKPFDKKTLLKVINECIGRTSPTIL
jgi:signal transduction histidine kinase/ActR/RegA family two-component response regulator